MSALHFVWLHFLHWIKLNGSDFSLFPWFITISQLSRRPPRLIALATCIPWVHFLNPEALRLAVFTGVTTLCSIACGLTDRGHIMRRCGNLHWVNPPFGLNFAIFSGTCLCTLLGGRRRPLRLLGTCKEFGGRHGRLETGLRP